MIPYLVASDFLLVYFKVRVFRCYLEPILWPFFASIKAPEHIVSLICNVVSRFCLKPCLL